MLGDYIQVRLHPRSQGFSAASRLAEKPWERGWLDIQTFDLSLHIRYNTAAHVVNSAYSCCFFILFCISVL